MRGWIQKFVLGAVVASAGAANAQNLPPEYFEAIIKSTVQFVCFDQSGQSQWRGSGSFIGREGIILTNNHVVMDEDTNKPCPVLRISVMKNEDQPPEPRYIAKIIITSAAVDLAIVQIVSDLRGNPVAAGTRFPAVPLGDSSTVRIGERIFNFGFPEISSGNSGISTSDTITVSSGSVNGFLSERTLMKHDALSGPGGSGGGIYNLRGELIAVHSAGVAGNNNSRQPLGRPLALALPLIQPNVRGLGEPWTTQLGASFTPPVVTPVNVIPTTTQPPLLPGAAGNQPPLLPVNTATGAPNFPPKPNQTWTVALDGFGSWTVSFTKLDEDGDPIGTAKNGQRTGNAFAFQTQSGTYRFQIFLPEDKSSFFCDFVRLQVSGNAFIGGQSGRADPNPSGGSRIFTDLKTSCVTAFGSSVQLAGVGQTPTPSGSLLASFPPKPGQAWSLTIDGLAPWAINFTKLDSDGDPTGSATQNGVTKTAFAFTIPVNTGRRYFQVFDARAVYYCIFPNAVQVSGSSLIGGQAFTAPTPDADAVPMNKACTAAITADPSQASSPQPPAPPPIGLLSASFPPKPGQSWTLTIDGLAPWALNFTKLDSDGDPTGTGVQSGSSKPVFAYKLQSGTYRFQVFDARSAIFVCDFPVGATINGATVVGGAAGTAPNQDANLTPLNKSCSVTLLSSALLGKASSDPLLQAAAPIKMLFKF